MVWKKTLRFEDGLQSVDRVYVVKVGELFKKIMIIRCPVVKSPLLKCCTATPNIPVSHSQPSSIWFLDYWRTGSVMVGTSDLSAAMLFAPPPNHHGTPDKTSNCHIGCDHINKNKPVCYQGELEEDCHHSAQQQRNLTRSGTLLWSEVQMLSRMFIKNICVLSLIFYHSVLL